MALFWREDEIEDPRGPLWEFVSQHPFERLADEDDEIDETIELAAVPRNIVGEMKVKWVDVAGHITPLEYRGYD